MKKLLLTVSALAALSLLGPSTGFTFENQIGFYNDLDQSATFIEGYNVPAPFSVYVMINDPYNPNTAAPVANLGGFEFLLTMPVGAYIFDSSYPVQALNIGDVVGEYIVGFGQPLPVVSDTPTLVLTLTVFCTSTGYDQFFFLTPTHYPGIPGEIALMDFDTRDIIPMCMVIGGSFDYPIFAINPVPPVAVDEISFDGVKALFR